MSPSQDGDNRPILVGPPTPAPPRMADLSLPRDLTVDAATPGTPAHVARFLGAWIGFWGGGLPHVLVVERVAADGAASVLYAVGDSPDWGVTRTWRRVAGTVGGDRLMVASTRAQISYAFEPDGRLLGRYLLPNEMLAVGILQSIAVEALFDPDRLVPHAQLGEAVRIPHASVMRPDGARPIELEATLYRPAAASAPLAVISHGSTGGYKIDPGRTFRHEAEALWLMEHGFAVLVPMRRGRGASEGVFGEELHASLDMRPGLEEAVEDLASTIVYGRALPFVQDCPVLLVGQSRGGFLSIVYAGRSPEAVAGVVSFAGGWISQHSRNSFNAELLEEAGRTARAPQLWLYGKRDSHYGVAHIRTNHAAFVRAGGDAALKIFSVPGDGHFLIGFPGLWRPAADAYLARLVPRFRSS